MTSWIWFSILACGDAPSEESTQSIKTVETSSKPPSQVPMGKPKPPQQVGPNGSKMGPPNALNGPNGLPGSTPSEDLSDSWKDALSVDAGTNDLQKTTECPDADGDGFVDATICGDLVGPDKADCDDSNSSVTPKTERYIPTSRFIMGSASSHAVDESPVHIVHLDGYCLDVAETTVADFAGWLNDTKRLPSGKDVRSLVVSDATVSIEPNRENHPAEGVTWKEAHDFCAANGQSLPTEAQWEKAARGGCELGDDATKCDPSDLRAYPWGNDTPSCELANHQLSASGLPKLWCPIHKLPMNCHWTGLMVIHIWPETFGSMWPTFGTQPFTQQKCVAIPLGFSLVMYTYSEVADGIHSQQTCVLPIDFMIWLWALPVVFDALDHS